MPSLTAPSHVCFACQVLLILLHYLCVSVRARATRHLSFPVIVTTVSADRGVRRRYGSVEGRDQAMLLQKQTCFNTCRLRHRCTAMFFGGDVAVFFCVKKHTKKHVLWQTLKKKKRRTLLKCSNPPFQVLNCFSCSYDIETEFDSV